MVTNVGKCNSPLFSSFVSYGVIGVAVAREIVALQGTDHPRDFPPNIGVYASWLDSLPDKQEVLGSSPRAPTIRILFTASKQSRDRKSHHKGASSLYLPFILLLSSAVEQQTVNLLVLSSNLRGAANCGW